ncbi:MAG: ABC transporter ATP-binding protein [Alphaproteobacteria bacterium]
MTPLLELREVSKRYGETTVLPAFSLAVREGEFITVLGPSGSGKTTVLRIIAGFVRPDAGTILLDDRDITRMPINRRPFNTVFQDYALFPHMTVAGNVSYGLRMRGVARHEVVAQVREALELVQLTGLESRFPTQLSGGQQQRVALARAIVCRPRLILLDEPLAALDVELRQQMQLFLKDIQHRIRTTFLFVTHDQQEAIAIADRICIMRAGEILQLGPVDELYYRPASEFVARFFGENNLIEGVLGPVDGTVRAIDTPVGRLRCSIDGQPAMAAAADGSRAFAVFRPEAVTLGSGEASAANRTAGRVAGVVFNGALTSVEVAVPAATGALGIRLRFPSRVDRQPVRTDDEVTVAWRVEECRLVAA